MGKLINTTAMTVDGVIDVSDWFVAAGEHDAASLGLFDGDAAMLLGRKTYEGFAASWPLVGDDDPIAAKLNHMPKYVASRTLKTAEWANTTVLSGDVAEEVAKLKEQPGGEIHVSGSGNLVQTLLRNDLVDEFVLLVFPVLVGTGKRLFGDGTVPGTLELVESASTGTGVLICTYRRRGPLEVGAVGPEQEGNE